MNKFYQQGIYSKTYNGHNNENGSTKLIKNANQLNQPNEQSKSIGKPLNCQASIFKPSNRSNGLYVNNPRIYTNHNPINSSTKYYFKSVHNQILKENNYQLSLKNLKRTKPKLKLKFKTLNSLNTSKYKKIYRTSTLTASKSLTSSISVPNSNPKYQFVHQFRKKAVKSSINCLLKKNNKLKLSTINTAYCMFFIRYGKCAKIDTCPYKHDKDKIRMCKGFLKGKCEVNGCLLSHKIEPDKMPVCSFFLKGICNIDNCQYRHVNVAEDAEICKEFVNGFCSKGDQCKLLHRYAQPQCSKCKGKSDANCECKKKKQKKMRRKSVDLKNKETIDENSLARPPSNDQKIELIELSSSESNSNMDISDDDCHCLEDKFSLDFIPLVKDDLSEDVKKSPKDEELNTFTEYNEYQNYDSDDSWFENNDETNDKNEFIHYIPKYLLN